MSGHSHFKSIKYQKAITDAKRSQAFSKVAREITVAAREGGADPNFNSKLRLIIEKAKSISMPTDNIERAVKKGGGELSGEKLEEVLFEAYGPGGIALIIEGITDNKNRTLSEIKQILNQSQGKLAGEGSVKWMFERKGCISIALNLQSENLKDKDKIEIAAIESGAQAFYWHDNSLDVYTKIENLDSIRKKLEKEGIKIKSASLDWVAKEEISLEENEKESCQKLFEALDENEATQGIYSNIKLP